MNQDYHNLDQPTRPPAPIADPGYQRVTILRLEDPCPSVLPAWNPTPVAQLGDACYYAAGGGLNSQLLCCLRCCRCSAVTATIDSPQWAFLQSIDWCSKTAPRPPSAAVRLYGSDLESTLCRQHCQDSTAENTPAQRTLVHLYPLGTRLNAKPFSLYAFPSCGGCTVNASARGS